MVDTTDKALLNITSNKSLPKTSESLSIMIHQHQSINQSTTVDEYPII
jgi:hypothetical protein